MVNLLLLVLLLLLLVLLFIISFLFRYQYLLIWLPRAVGWPPGTRSARILFLEWFNVFVLLFSQVFTRFPTLSFLLFVTLYVKQRTIQQHTTTNTQHTIYNIQHTNNKQQTILAANKQQRTNMSIRLLCCCIVRSLSFFAIRSLSK